MDEDKFRELEEKIRQMLEAGLVQSAKSSLSSSKTDEKFVIRRRKGEKDKRIYLRHE